MSLSKEVKEPFKDLFTLGEFDAIINLREDELLHAVSYRKDAEEEVKKVFRDMNNHGRDMYASFIQNVGRNIYPVIVASDHEPGFSGVGSTFTLFLANGESILMYYVEMSTLQWQGVLIFLLFCGTRAAQRWLEPLTMIILHHML